MGEPSNRRDRREIELPADLRASRPGRVQPSGRSRRETAEPRVSPPPGELRAMLVGTARWLGTTCVTKPWQSAGTAAALVAAGFVAVNALGNQDGRHPAPILPQPAQQVANATPPAAKPPAPLPAEPVKPEPRHVEAAPPRDAIGDMIRNPGDTTASVTPHADKTDKSVMQAQRALAKLGYGPLKPDGQMGGATRAAIEKFERDRKLPVTGEAAGRTLRELAARAAAAKG